MKFLKYILPSILLALSLCFISGCNNEASDASLSDDSSSSSYTGSTIYSNPVLNRDLGDVAFELSERSVAIRIIPVVNITDLVVKVQHFDADKNVIDSQVITVGNTIEGQQYVINSALTENSFTEGKTIKSCRLEVYSGWVYYTVGGGSFIKE